MYADDLYRVIGLCATSCNVICRVRANSRRWPQLARSLVRARVYIRSAKRNIRNECVILIRRVKGTLREECGYTPRVCWRALRHTVERASADRCACNTRLLFVVERDERVEAPPEHRSARY